MLDTFLKGEIRVSFAKSSSNKARND